MYNEEKTAQMAGYLLKKHNGIMPYLKLMKLLYLADRQSMLKYGDSMTGDSVVAMRLGPVLSNTYDRICEDSEAPSSWNDWIKDEADKEVSLRKHEVRNEDFDLLSKADEKILDNVFAEFGHYHKYALVNVVHELCKEWKDPGRTSIPIPPKDIFLAGGLSEAEADELVNRMDDQDKLKRLHALMV